MINKLANQLAYKANKLNIIKEEDTECYVYSFEKLIHQLLTYILIIGIGIVLNRIVELLIYCISLTILRGQTGGYHAQSRGGCILLSIAISSSAVLITRVNLTNIIYLVFPLVIISIVYILIYSPINHRNLDLTESEIICLKRTTKRIVFVEFMLVICSLLIQALRVLFLPIGLAIISVAFFMFLAKKF